MASGISGASRDDLLVGIGFMRGMHRGWHEAAKWLDKATQGNCRDTVDDMLSSYPWHLEEKLTSEAMRVRDKDLV